MASAVPPAETPTAHTTTEQWQSFEMRMRQRRIDRLLLRAQIAHEAGRDDEAREALDEAAQLNGQSASLADLLPPPADPAGDAQIVQETTDIAVDEAAGPVRGTRSWIPRIAAVLTVIAVLWFNGRRVSDEPAMSTFAQSMIPSDAVRAETTPETEAQPVRASIADVATTNAAPAPAQPAPELREVSLAGRETELPQPTGAALTPRSGSRGEPTALPAVAQVHFSPAAAAPPAVPVAGSEVLDPPSSPPPVAPPILEAAPSATSRVVPSTSEAGPEAPVPAARQTASDDNEVRAVLARYESAYSRLDVDAAAAVWPGLDRGALARAFGGLSSQSVSLGSCDVRIMGEIAVADCAGSATWTPKVGGGSRSHQRRWQFRLRNSAGGWQIVGATMR